MNEPTGRELRTFLRGRAGLVNALWIAASVALGGCAPQLYVTSELPSGPAPAMDPIPAPAAPATPVPLINRDVPRLGYATPEGYGEGDLAPAPGTAGDPRERVALLSR
jgi:hypothetical protein